MSGKSKQSPQSEISLVTHELQAPLTVLRSRLEAALETSWCTGECQTFVAHCLDEVRAMNQLVVDILLLERLEAGGLPFTAGELDLAELAAQVGESFEAVAKGKGLTFQMNLGTPLPVLGDASQLRRVLVNLLDNAVKYTSPGGEVRLTGSPVGFEAEIEVMDSGAGIAPKELSRIFDRFYQVDKSASRESGGVGLGLSIARALAEENSGTLDVRSEPQRGSRFILKIPLVQTDAESK